MSSNLDRRRTLLDATLTEPSRRERRQLVKAGVLYGIISFLGAWEVFHQSLSRRLVERPEWWFTWCVFGFPSLISLFLALSRFWMAQSTGNPPGWTSNIVARLPPNVARLAGLPPRETRRNRGGVFTGRNWGGHEDDEVPMTTPEVLRSTSLRNRSAARNSATPLSNRHGGVSGEPTPGQTTPNGRRLFSPENTLNGGRLGRLSPMERAETGKLSLSIRPQDVEGLIKGFKKKYAKPTSKAQETSSSRPPQLPTSISNTAPYPAAPAPGVGNGVIGITRTASQERGYYTYGQAGDAGAGGPGTSSLPYQAYEPGEADVKGPGRKGDNGDSEEAEREKDMAKQLLIRLGLAERADDITTNVKTYVVRLMRKFLAQFDVVCSLLHERGIAAEVLCQQLQRQPQLKVKNTPRVLINLSLKDMAVQFGHQAEFWVKGPDGNPVSLFLMYQHLEEALQVTAGSGVPGVGNPAYVLERLKVLAEDDFMSAFDYDNGGMYPAGRDWSEELPTDAAVVMRLFVCCSDDLLPRQWDKDRPFARQHLVDRQPCKSDALPGRFFLTRNDALHPPYYLVVADEEVWHALPGPTNVFQAIALFFYAIKTHKSGYLGTGISVASIMREMFGS
ncbi:unnamed protein product [Ascophyllum nodosum]